MHRKSVKIWDTCANKASLEHTIYTIGPVGQVNLFVCGSLRRNKKKKNPGADAINISGLLV